MTLNDIAYEYNWEKWGDKYIREKARFSILIDVHTKTLYIQVNNLEIDLLTGLKATQIIQLMKIFGAKI